MIKSTFYNLPEEKRRRVIGAIVAEFSNTEDEKISINRIIKRADISRGSFYQYFDDKVDLVEVLLKVFVEQILAGVRQACEESDGDLFYTYRRLFEIIAECGGNPVRHTVLGRLMSNLRANDDLVSEYMTNRFRGIDEFKEYSRRFSRKCLRYKDDGDFELLSQILTGMLKNALFNYFVCRVPYEKVKANYERKIEILERGALLEAPAE